jgi:hypothetical protein
VKIKSCIKILTQACVTLKKYKHNPGINIDYLEGVAGTKFAIMEVAHLIHSQFSSEGKAMFDQSVEQLGGAATTLLEATRKICTDPVINTTTIHSGSVNVTGPVMYLLKLLVRHFNFPCLKPASETYPWIVPTALRTSNLVGHSCHSKLAVCYGSRLDQGIYQRPQAAVSRAQQGCYLRPEGC